MASIHQLDDLQCYQLGLNLAVEIDGVSRIYRSKDNYPLCNQIRRASISVPANIAEGFGRSTTKEFARFVEISRGSGYEVQTLLVLGHMLGYLSDDEFAPRRDTVSRTLGKLTAFHKYLRNSKAPYLP